MGQEKKNNCAVSSSGVAMVLSFHLGHTAVMVDNRLSFSGGAEVGSDSTNDTTELLHTTHTHTHTSTSTTFTATHQYHRNKDSCGGSVKARLIFSAAFSETLQKLHLLKTHCMNTTNICL